jgi:hypothetical protein
MPKIDPAWGGRYVPAVKTYLDSRHGLVIASPFTPEGKEGTSNMSKKRKLAPPTTSEKPQT